MKRNILRSSKLENIVDNCAKRFQFHGDQMRQKMSLSLIKIFVYEIVRLEQRLCSEMLYEVLICFNLCPNEFCNEAAIGMNESVCVF